MKGNKTTAAKTTTNADRPCAHLRSPELVREIKRTRMVVASKRLVTDAALAADSVHLSHSSSSTGYAGEGAHRARGTRCMSNDHVLKFNGHRTATLCRAG